MSSRTTMKQQIMREQVMNEERPQNEVSSMTNQTYTDDGFISPSNNNYLSSFTSTSVTSKKHSDYCKRFLSNTKDIVYNFATNSSIGEDIPIINFDFRDTIKEIDSPYILQNVYPTDNRYNFSDFSHQSSNIKNLIDSNSYNNNFHNLNNKIHEIDQVHDIYRYETSFSCPATPDQSTSSYKQRRMSNFNSAASGTISLNYVEKQMQLKERSKKESHNRIERKRRDFINQKIIELGNLLPRQMTTDGESKKNKGNILKNAVVYIQHLQSEAKNTFNSIKEASLAYNLVENYRKQIQNIQQLKSFCSQNGSSLSDPQNTTEIYSQYLMLREQNQRNIQSTDHLSLSSNNTLLSEIQSNGSPYKIETNSAHSSQGNNSSNSTYRKDEEDKDESIPHNEMLSPRQYTQKCSPSDNEYFFNSSNHSSGFERQRLESMEC